ncbi:MAG: MmcQ/YjbR family DNA-binding protein [Paramuribaculum sp.]|nr:MmcQ/YjbR family DNA-binding protein [Paramuribaculum sp.]
MNIEDLRQCGLSIPHTTERCPFGPDTLSLEIGGKMFCLIDLSCEWDFYNLKVHPDVAVELIERFPGIRPGYHMNKRHWVSIPYANSIPLELERRLILHSVCCTAAGIPRSHRPELPPDEPNIFDCIAGIR